MAFADPQSVDIGAGAVSLPRTASGTSSGGFTSADGSISLLVSNSVGNRIRRRASVQSSKIVTDPFTSTRNIPVYANAYIVLDVPPTGFTAAELKTLVTGLTTWLTASSGANIVKLIGNEN